MNVSDDVYEFAKIKSLARLPDMTTEELIPNGLSYTTFQHEKDIICACYESSASPIGYEFNPVSNNFFPIQPVLKFQVNALIPNSLVKIHEHSTGTLPSFTVMHEGASTIHSMNEIAVIDFSFEAVTPMFAAIAYETSEALHSQLAGSLLEFGSPVPCVLPIFWFSMNLDEVKKTEHVEMKLNNHWCAPLADAILIDALLRDHFDIDGSVCSLKNNFIPGGNNFNFELNNSAIYSRSIILRA